MLTSAVNTAEPPVLLVQVKVKVVLVAIFETTSDEFVDLVPLQPFEAVQVSALAMFQASVVDPLAATDAGVAVRVPVGVTTGTDEISIV